MKRFQLQNRNRFFGFDTMQSSQQSLRGYTNIAALLEVVSSLMAGYVEFFVEYLLH